MLFKKGLVFNAKQPIRTLFATQKPNKLQDWQYVSHIQKHLRLGEVDQALKYLINSYFNQQTLDIQIYHNLHQKIKQKKFDLTYHQITYKLYREFFQPHVLMLQWMRTLTKSDNQRTLQLIQQDYKVLGKQFLTSQKAQTLQYNSLRSELKQFEHTSKPQTSSQEVKDTQKEREPSNYSIDPEQLKTVVSLLFNKYSKIIIHDAVIKCENYVQEYEDEEEEKMWDEEENTVTSIFKINFGKIQIFSKDDKDDKNDPEQCV